MNEVAARLSAKERLTLEKLKRSKLEDAKEVAMVVDTPPKKTAAAHKAWNCASHKPTSKRR